MDSKKKDLEIIYNLQWKNKPGNSAGDKANIIGMYDIPATTLNWEIFKSYLLKNSGTVGDDVKVFYITDSNREFPIESQTDFQIALYAFRRKARMGDIVNLKLDRISDHQQQTYKNSRHSNDVETQFDLNETTTSLASTCCNNADNSPPDWFIAYMDQFKKNLTDELAITVSGIVSNIKPQGGIISQPACYHHHVRKSKMANGSKGLRKLAPHLTVESSHETKDIIKSLKLEGKLERKLEKLENKTKKIRDKKLAIFTKSSDDSETGGCGTSSYRKSNKSNPPPPPSVGEDNDFVLEMDAAPTNTQAIIPHMLGGEIYLHQWEVVNSGKLPWTNKTVLMFTWGSKALKPLDAIVSVPYLRPGEVGTISVRLQIPNQPGQYECYWHFHHKERRFGHWLGCQVIVDPFDLKGNKSVLETSFESSENTVKQLEKNKSGTSSDEILYYNNLGTGGAGNVVKQYSDVWQDSNSVNNTSKYKIKENIYMGGVEQNFENVVRDISTKVEDMKLHDPTDTNCSSSSDSENPSIISLTEGSTLSKSVTKTDEYIVVPMPECFQISCDNNTTQSGHNVETVEGGDATATDSKKSADVVVAPSSKEMLAVDDALKVLARFDDNNNAGETTNHNSSSKESILKLDGGCSSSSSCSSKSDIVMVTFAGCDEATDEYAFIIVDGQKVPVPKKIIKSEYLHTFENTKKSPPIETRSRASSIEIVEKQEVILPHTSEKIIPSSSSSREYLDPVTNSAANDNDFASHCSAAGSCFSDLGNSTVGEKNSRLFIFPQDCPGFEVLYPNLNDIQVEAGDNFCEQDSSKALLITDGGSSKTHPSHPNDDPFQTPCESLLMPPTTTTTVVSQSFDEIPTAPPDSNPFFTRQSSVDHVPNFQQTPSKEQRQPVIPPSQVIPEPKQTSPPPPPPFVTSDGVPVMGDASSSPHAVVHILPETLVSGAVNVARSVIRRIVPQGISNSPTNDIPQQQPPGRWINGHWVSSNPMTAREANLQALAEMGFWNRDLNATLLARYDDDLSRVVAELVH